MHIRYAISLADIGIQFLDNCPMINLLSTNMDSLEELVYLTAYCKTNNVEYYNCHKRHINRNLLYWWYITVKITLFPHFYSRNKEAIVSDPITEKEAVALMGGHTIGKVGGFRFINDVCAIEPFMIMCCPNYFTMNYRKQAAPTSTMSTLDCWTLSQMSPKNWFSGTTSATSR